MTGKGSPHLLPTDVVTFQAWLENLRTERFTGSLVLHMHDGVPGVLEFGRPMRAQLLDAQTRTSNSQPTKSLTGPPPAPHTPD